MLTLDEYYDLIQDFVFHPEFEGIHNQIWGEYNFGGINFGHIEYYEWFGPTKTVKKNGVTMTYCVKYEA